MDAIYLKKCWTACVPSLEKKRLTTKIWRLFLFVFEPWGHQKVIYELSIRGYQYDTAILNRSLFENSIALWYVTKSEDNGKKWLSGKKHYSDIKKELGISSDNVLTAFYGSRSDFVHSNFAAILSLINSSGENVLECAVEPELGLSEKGNFLGNFWAFPLKMLLHHYESSFTPETKDMIEKIIEKAKVSPS